MSIQLTKPKDEFVTIKAASPQLSFCLENNGEVVDGPFENNVTLVIGSINLVDDAP